MARQQQQCSRQWMVTAACGRAAVWQQCHTQHWLLLSNRRSWSSFLGASALLRAGSRSPQMSCTLVLQSAMLPSTNGSNSRQRTTLARACSAHARSCKLLSARPSLAGWKSSAGRSTTASPARAARRSRGRRWACSRPAYLARLGVLRRSRCGCLTARARLRQRRVQASSRRTSRSSTDACLRATRLCSSCCSSAASRLASMASRATRRSASRCASCTTRARACPACRRLRGRRWVRPTRASRWCETWCCTFGRQRRCAA